MTTPAAARFYLAKHQLEMDGKPYAIFNPNNLPVETLPIIFGFNNGASLGGYSGMLIAEDGTGLGGHICSHEDYMYHDLGILEDCRLDRHQTFQKHYPNGYRMTFVKYGEVKSCEPLLKAFELNKNLAAAEKIKEGATP